MTDTAYACPTCGSVYTTGAAELCPQCGDQMVPAGVMWPSADTDQPVLVVPEDMAAVLADNPDAAARITEALRAGRDDRVSVGLHPRDLIQRADLRSFQDCADPRGMQRQVALVAVGPDWKQRAAEIIRNSRAGS